MISGTRRLSLLLAGLLASLLVTGCALQELASCSPPAAGAPAQGPECTEIIKQVERDAHTVENVLRFADWIVVADVIGVQDSVWNTPDGRPPVVEARGHTAGIVTPVDVVIHEVVVGAGPGGGVRVVLEGGTVGNTTHGTEPPPPVLVPGNRYALIMIPSVDAAGVKHPELPLVVEAWPINEDGDIVTTFDGILSVDELAAMSVD